MSNPFKRLKHDILRYEKIHGRQVKLRRYANSILRAQRAQRAQHTNHNTLQAGAIGAPPPPTLTQNDPSTISIPAIEVPNYS